MNNDPTSSPQLPADDALEARIVAWILGEASAFEIAELERLLAQNPELVAFKQRLQTTHDLLEKTSRPVTVPLQLPPEKRQALLKALPLSSTSALPGAAPEVTVLESTPRKPQKSRRWGPEILTYGSVAALIILLGAMTRSAFQRVRPVRPDPMQIVGETSVSQAEQPVQNGISLETSDADELKQSAYGKRRADMVSQTAEKRAQEQRLTPTPSSTRLGYVPSDKQVLPDASGFAPSAMPAQANSEGELQAPPMTQNPPAALISTGIADTTAKEKRLSEDSAHDYKGNGVRDRLVTEESVSNSLNFAVRGALTATASNVRGAGQAGDSTVTLEPLVLGGENRYKKSAEGTIGAAGGKVVGGFDFITNKALMSPSVAPASPPAPPAEPADGAPKQPLNTKDVATDPVSTFSLHVSDASFHFALNALRQGTWPEPSRIRAEEFVNAFDYGDPAPASGEQVGCKVEQARSPLWNGATLLRIALKVPAAGRDTVQPLHLTLLLDTSGSMLREDRAGCVQAATQALAALLGPNDRVSLIGFSREPRILARNVPGNEVGRFLTILHNEPYETGTDIEAALALAGSVAQASYSPGAQNRIVLLTDGAANVGNVAPASLGQRVAELRQRGIVVDACGVGTDVAGDEVLEALARKGNGRHYLLANAEEAGPSFAEKIAGALRPAAVNVKVQVRFNPERVLRYRLIGFEQHQLREEDFRNDKVTAAQLAAGETGVALYEVQLKPDGDGELGTVGVRFLAVEKGSMVENFWPLLFEARPPDINQALPSLQLAALAALFAEKLGQGPLASSVTDEVSAPLVTRVRAHYQNDPRVAALTEMYNRIRILSGW